MQTIGTQALSTTYDYNPFTGNLQALTLPSGHVVSYTWVGGRINAIAVDGQAQVSGIAYQPFEAAKSWAFGNGETGSRRPISHQLRTLRRAVRHLSFGRG